MQRPAMIPIGRARHDEHSRTCRSVGHCSTPGHGAGPLWVLVLTSVLVGSPAFAAPRDFYVSSKGNDTQPGTAAKPFATVQRAMRAVRGLKLAKSPGTPVTVYLRGGTHELTEKLVFGPEDTGTAQSPVTYTSCPGERAVISGGRRITGRWTKSPGKPYWQISTAEARGGTWVFNSLFVNGRSRQRARWPNSGEKVLRAQGRAPGEDARQAFEYSPGDIDPEWTNLTDVDVVLLCSWTPTVHRIEEVVRDRRVVRFHSSHGRTVDAWEKNFRYYAINVFEALDAPGEWYLDRHTGVLYYYPMPGEDMANAEVVAPVVKSTLIEFRGDVDAGRPVSHLRFKGLAFKHVDGDLDRYNGVYRQGHMYLSAAIYAEGLQASTFVDCEIAQVGEYAMELEAGCQRNRIERCHIWDTGAGAMQIGITSLRAALAERTRIRENDLVLEAEDADVTAPMVVVDDDDASKGRCVVSPQDAPGGSVVFRVQIGEAGQYRLFTRVIAPSGNADSFHVQIGEGKRLTYDTGTHAKWFFSPVVARELDNRRLVADLQRGVHVITIAGREPGTKLDQLILRPVRDDASPEEARSKTAVLSNVIDNNFIHRTGTIWHGCYSIVNRFASLSQITHNEITDVHWDAIGLDARWNYKGEKYSHGNVVAYNHLHHLGLGYHTDAGGVYQFGPLDTHIHHNLIHDTVAYPYICGYGGVYLDQQSRGALVENNLVYNVDWFAYFQHKGVDNTFRNNIGAFARDGFILRGGLNERWKANWFEAYGNIYIAKDRVAIRRKWDPGLKPSVMQRNMYFSTTAGADMTFGGKSLAEWQAEGLDEGSVIGDPGCKDPASFDFSLKPDAPAIKAIGFKPFDDEIRKAGLYGDPEWVALPKRYKRRTPSPAWTGEDLQRFIAFSLDFEGMPDGYEPNVFRLAKEGEATFAVTSEVACTGKRSYKCVDRKGLRKPFYPYIHIAPRKLTQGKITLSFDVMNSTQAPMRFYVEVRGKGSTSDVGPSLHFYPDGSFKANGRDIATTAHGVWRRIEVRFELGEAAAKEYTLVTRCGDEETRQTIPFTHSTFSEIRWLGVSAASNADGVFYLDNLGFKIE